jgi:hypothetical protein
MIFLVMAFAPTEAEFAQESSREKKPSKVDILWNEEQFHSTESLEKDPSFAPFPFLEASPSPYPAVECGGWMMAMMRDWNCEES